MKRTRTSFVICVDNSDYEASLIVGKVYQLLKDPVAAKDSLVRIVDESGEDYLYDRTHFELVDLSPTVTKKLLALQKAS